MSAKELTGNWKEDDSLDVTCFDISYTEIKCTFRATDQIGSSTTSFIVDGPSIRSAGAHPRYPREIIGTYNHDYTIITWKNGASDYKRWTRPSSRPL